MVDISEEVAVITNSTYGEDVRSAIASAAVKLAEEGNGNLESMQETEDQINAIIHGGGDDDDG